MKISKVLYDDGEVQWVMISRDPSKPDSVIDTNEYLVISGDEAIILDPGGTEIFPNVLTAVSEIIDLKKIKGYLCSHQDPDILSSLPLWMNLTPNATIYVSWLWQGFISHFGHEFSKNFNPLPDQGLTIKLGKRDFQFVPAHHLHSSGNFNFYDPEAKILFTGDIGSALLPSESPLLVTNFDQHIPFMEKFHLRWMPSNYARDIWVNRIRKLGPEKLLPQHGAYFEKENVTKFLDWFMTLDLGRLT